MMILWTSSEASLWMLLRGYLGVRDSWRVLGRWKLVLSLTLRTLCELTYIHMFSIQAVRDAVLTRLEGRGGRDLRLGELPWPPRWHWHWAWKLLRTEDRQLSYLGNRQRKGGGEEGLDSAIIVTAIELNRTYASSRLWAAFCRWLRLVGEGDADGGEMNLSRESVVVLASLPRCTAR
jgi:hypothetical protein